MTDRKTLDQMTSDDLDQLYAELDRLHAGEEPGYDPAVVPTPGQWLRRFNEGSAEERLDVIARMLDASARAATCFQMNHEARLADDRKAWVIVARIRDVIADMEGITGARHWARILRKVVDGEEPVSELTATQATNESCCGKPPGAACVHDVSVPKQQPGEQVREAIESEVYEYRERTMLWEETGGVTEEIARLATRGAMKALAEHHP